MAPKHLLTTATTLLALLASLTTPPSAASHPAATTLRLDYFAGYRGRLARSLDPALAYLPADVAAVQMVNAGLVRLLPNGRVVPDLATWKVSKNRLVYTFTIRKNARFSNGHPVTGDDAVFSIKRALDPTTASFTAMIYLGAITGAANYNAGKARDLPGVKVLGRRVLQITAIKPIAYFLTMLSYPTGDVLDRSVVAGRTAAATNNYLSSYCPGNQGAGPFEFRCFGDSFSPPGEARSYTLVPNPKYIGHKPHIQVLLPSFATPDSSYSAYLAGDVDATPFSLNRLQTWRNKKREYRQYPTSRVRFLVPNVHLRPFNDVHCRRALAYAVNRRKLGTDIYESSAEPLYGLTPTAMHAGSVGGNPHFNPSRASMEISHCAERAISVALIFDVGSPTQDSLYTAIVGMMNAIGFNAKTRYCSGTSECSQPIPLDKINAQIEGFDWFPDFPDPADYFMLLRCNGDYNLGAWCNSRFDTLVDRADTEWNSAKRTKLYAQAEHLALNAGALISLLNPYTQELVKPYVHGLVGTFISPELAPKNGDWSNVSVSR